MRAAQKREELGEKKGERGERERWGREGEERTWSRGCQAGPHEALTCPKGSRWLLVSLSFWKETSCRIQCAPVAGESGCTYRRPGMAGSALPVTDLDQGEANRPALAPRGAGSPCTGPGLPRDARGASRPLAASQPSAGSGSLDVRKSLGKLLAGSQRGLPLQASELLAAARASYPRNGPLLSCLFYSNTTGRFCNFIKRHVQSG